jgi:asparagine synthase (glutamine-hydrolysing)
MCGISGIVKLNGSPVTKSEVGELNDSMDHRGPDASGVWRNKNVGIGHRRLAIIDLKTGAQPMFNIDKTIGITFNGEIYNYLDLRAELQRQGYKFATTSDTEVIINAYAHWGDDCVKHFRGMFAFAIVDLRKQRMFIARDQLGIKPLVYYIHGNTFAFASEIHAFKKLPHPKLDINLPALDQYLWLQYIPAPQSIFKQVFKLPPAHRMSVSFDGKVFAPEEYWRLEFQPDYRRSERDWLHDLEEVLEDSVKSHLIADVPVGAFLSGGIDSSAVVALAAKALDRPLKTFSMGFEEPEFDESPYALQAAKIWKTEHFNEIVKPDSLDILPGIVHHFGEPFGDSSAIPTYYVSKLARKHVTVSLSGDGGDEMFAGYQSYQTWMQYLESIAPEPGRVGKVIQKYLGKPSMANLNVWMNVIQYIPTADRISLWRPDYQENIGESLGAFELAFDRTRSFTDLSKAQYTDIKTYLPFDILTKVDIASMCHSLESRTPLVDVRVAEFAAQIPPEINYRITKDGEIQGKVLLKKLLEKYYPREFVYRQKKGFSMPITKWFSSGGSYHSEVQSRLLGRNSLLHEYFEPEKIKQFINEGKQPWVWLLLFLEEWLRQNK